LVFSAPWFLPPRLSLLRWQVPPHCQHNCRLFLWLSAGLDCVNTEAVGASLTGTSSWPVVAHGIPRPLSRGKPAGYPTPGWTLSLHRQRTPKIFRARCPRDSPLSASLTTGIVRPEPTFKTHCRRRCLALRQSRMPQRRWPHVTAFPASSCQRPVCPRSFSFRNLLSSSSCPTHGTYTPPKPVFNAASLGRHTCRFEVRWNVW
jgi:hypothetical protein